MLIGPMVVQVGIQLSSKVFPGLRLHIQKDSMSLETMEPCLYEGRAFD